MAVRLHHYFETVFPCDRWQVSVNGESVRPMDGENGDFITLEADEGFALELRGEFISAQVYPKRRGLQVEVLPGYVRVISPTPQNIAVRTDMHTGADQHFFAFVSPFTEPSAGARVIRAGEVETVDQLELSEGDEVFVEGGAVLSAVVRSHRSSNIKLRGPGVIDGGRYRREGRHPTVMFESCRDALIENCTVVWPTMWMVIPALCERVRIENLHLISHTIGGDGIDVCASQDVDISGGMFRTNDDCIVLKALGDRHSVGAREEHWFGDLRRIHASGSVLLNDRAGNALEVGHELRCDWVEDVSFSDIEIGYVDGYGAAFSIHAGDRATVRNIRFERIAVHHHYDKLIDFRVMRSRFNHDAERGRIEDIVLKNIDVVESEFNPGYTTSLIGGWDAQHLVQHVRFQNFRVNGEVVLDGDRIDLHTRHVRGIEFA